MIRQTLPALVLEAQPAVVNALVETGPWPSAYSLRIALTSASEASDLLKCCSAPLLSSCSLHPHSPRDPQAASPAGRAFDIEPTPKVADPFPDAERTESARPLACRIPAAGIEPAVWAPDQSKCRSSSNWPRLSAIVRRLTRQRYSARAAPGIG